jgi:transposase-like protein
MEKAPLTKRPRYEAAFRAEALRLASESRSTLAAAQAFNLDPKRLLYALKQRMHKVLANASKYLGGRSS